MKKRNNEMTSQFLRGLRWLCVGFASVGAASCYGGDREDGYDTISERSLDGVAEPSDDDPEPVERVPRDQWGESNRAADLSFRDLPKEGLEVLDPTTVNMGLGFFINEHTAEEGVGPVFNQTRCLGCHESSLDNADNGVSRTANGDDLTQNATIISRAHRHGPTDYSIIENLPPPPTNDVREIAGSDGIATASVRLEPGRPDTAAFTIFGDFNVPSGTFFPLPEFGGPVQHIRAVDGCPIDVIPPENLDANLSAPGTIRTLGERAGPSYTGRGLMEAIYYEDLAANEDPMDEQDSDSSLDPQPDPDICSGDCVSGRPNYGHSDSSFTGGSPVLRLGRFGLRAAGPAMLQFVVGGINGEVGFTSPLAPLDLNTPWATHYDTPCDQVPDPEVSVPQVTSVRAAIRLVAPPEFHEDLISANPDGTGNSAREDDIVAGATLFGVDFEEFKDIMIDGNGSRGDNAIAADRQLNCSGCHIPVHSTSKSPAEIGADHLSDKFAHVFSDLMLHDMGGFDPFSQHFAVEDRSQLELSRNLSDYSLPSQGVATGREFRTPPLWGIGRVGPPFFHDARVYVNPNNPAHLDSFTVGGVTTDLTIMTVEDALRAVIEMHDLPAPPGNDYAQCPIALDPAYRPIDDICSRESPYRSEARNTVEKWRLLSEAEQLQVVTFLLSL